MSNGEHPNDRIPTARVQAERRRFDDSGAVGETRQTISARAAAAQFDLAALLETPAQQPRDRALVAPAPRTRTDLITRPHDEALAAEAASERDAGRLPSAWYKQEHEIAEAARQERTALLIRGSAAACLVTGAALLFWLGAFGGRSAPPTNQQMASSQSFAPIRQVAVSAPMRPEVPLPSIVEPNARALVTTAQILAVAERFVATGDILAARAMLSDTAAAGDPRALFALAETYDPNLLASWNAPGIQPSPDYARLLYAAALKAGMSDAQSRLDALR